MREAYVATSRPGRFGNYLRRHRRHPTQGPGARVPSVTARKGNSALGSKNASIGVGAVIVEKNRRRHSISGEKDLGASGSGVAESRTMMGPKPVGELRKLRSGVLLRACGLRLTRLALTRAGRLLANDRRKDSLIIKSYRVPPVSLALEMIDKYRTELSS